MRRPFRRVPPGAAVPGLRRRAGTAMTDNPVTDRTEYGAVEPNRIHVCCVGCRTTITAPVSQERCPICRRIVNPQGGDR